MLALEQANIFDGDFGAVETPIDRLTRLQRIVSDVRRLAFGVPNGPILILGDARFLMKEPNPNFVLLGVGDVDELNEAFQEVGLPPIFPHGLNLSQIELLRINDVQNHTTFASRVTAALVDKVSTLAAQLENAFNKLNQKLTGIPATSTSTSTSKRKIAVGVGVGTLVLGTAIFLFVRRR